MADYTTYVDFGNGSDSNGGTSPVDAWLSLIQASSAQTYSSGDNVTIKVIPLADGARHPIDVGTRFQGTAASSGVNWVIESADGISRISISGSAPFNVASQLGGSLTIRNIDAEVTAWLVLLAGDASTNVTIDDAIAVCSTANRSIISTPSTADTPPTHTLNGGSFDGFTYLIEAPKVWDIIVDGITATNVGSPTMSRSVFYLGTNVNSLTITGGSSITMVADRNNQHIITVPLDSTLSSLVVTDSVLDMSAGDGTEQGSCVKVQPVAIGQTPPTLELRNNQILSCGSNAPILIGSIAAYSGVTRAELLATVGQFGDCIIADSLILNNCDGPAIAIGVGFDTNQLELTRCTIFGGPSAHTLEMAGNNLNVHDNYIAGQLASMIFGDGIEFYNNICVSNGTAGLLGRPSGTDWEVSQGGKIHKNLYYSTGTEFAFSDYAYNLGTGASTGYPIGSITHDINYNTYFAPNATSHVRLSNTGTGTGHNCTTVEELRNVWATDSLDGSGGVAWGDASIADTNDENSVIGTAEMLGGVLSGVCDDTKGEDGSFSASIPSATVELRRVRSTGRVDAIKNFAGLMTDCEIEVTGTDKNAVEVVADTARIYKSTLIANGTGAGVASTNIDCGIANVMTNLAIDLGTGTNLITSPNVIVDADITL